MRENNRNDKRNFERRDGKKRDFKGKRDYRDRDRKQEVQQADEEFTGGMVEGRNAVIEAFRSGKTVDKLFVLASSQDGPIRTIIREAKKHDTIINYVEKERLDELSTTGKHQGVIAQVASYSYATVERHIARGGVVLLVVEAVGVCKRAARHADALRRLVHPADEARDAPAAVVGQRDGRVVSRAEQQPVEQRLHGERLTGL